MLGKSHSDEGLDEALGNLHNAPEMRGIRAVDGHRDDDMVQQCVTQTPGADGATVHTGLQCFSKGLRCRLRHSAYNGGGKDLDGDGGRRRKPEPPLAVAVLEVTAREKVAGRDRAIGLDRARGNDREYAPRQRTPHLRGRVQPHQRARVEAQQAAQEVAIHDRRNSVSIGLRRRGRALSRSKGTRMDRAREASTSPSNIS